MTQTRAIMEISIAHVGVRLVRQAIDMSKTPIIYKLIKLIIPRHDQKEMHTLEKLDGSKQKELPYVHQ
jgi:hypothetical protein